ncbi:MAG TPA: beta-N-acetylglucosaminidase domain-containing protein [Candidatus Binatia bacterium]|jgi:hyaluronoglucosaminidase
MKSQPFQRRGIVEGFFGPLWSMAHRKAMLKFGAARGMNTYLYAPKDDPYHRERWTEPYPRAHWQALLQLISQAKELEIDFVYGFHPGKGLSFSDDKPVRTLLAKAGRFYDAGVTTFAVLFDDIPSRLEFNKDRKNFGQSLARAEASWLQEIQAKQPDGWKDLAWWICPSYYTPDPFLARVFGRFEPNFLEILAEYLPQNVACFWTGPSVVPKAINFSHVQKIARRIKHRLLLWDNYPVNDLSMRDELHLGPLQGRDPELPRIAYAYLNNPLLQEALSFIPLATCFDYAADPAHYHPEASWSKIISEIFGIESLPHWRALRRFCEAHQRAKKSQQPLRLGATQRRKLEAADAYIRAHRRQKWAREILPWQELLRRELQ